MSIRDMFRRQRTPQGLEELLGMMSNGSKPATPGKIKITQVEFGADFVTQLVETGLEQFGILDAIKKSAEEQVEEIRQSAQSQVDEAMERLQRERREMRNNDSRMATIRMEVREFVNGQIYAYQITHQALAYYTGRHLDRLEVPRKVKNAVDEYNAGNFDTCGSAECETFFVHQTLRQYDDVKLLAETLMADMQAAADDDDYRRWAEDEDAAEEGENEVEETEPVAEKAGGEPDMPYGTQQW